MIPGGKVKGFTLIELLIVLVIMSLLLSLVPPLFSNVMPSVTIKATANDFLHDLKYVRNIAVLSGRPTSIVINPVDGEYFSEAKDNGKTVQLPEGITVTVNTAALRTDEDNNVSVSFFSDGSSSGALILLTNEDKAYTLFVDWLTGEISLLEGRHDKQV